MAGPVRNRIDLSERRCALRLMNDFLRARLTNDELEEIFHQLNLMDRAVEDLESWLWLTYDDHSVHFVDRRQLTPLGRQTAARWRLYLAADQEPFPHFPGRLECRRRGIDPEEMLAFYPFANEAHLRRVETRYLAGS